MAKSTRCANEGLSEMHSSNLKMRRLWGDLNATFACRVEGYREDGPDVSEVPGK